MQIVPTSELPFAMVDGLGFFTIFNLAADAVRVAEGLVAQYAADGLTGTEFVVAERVDGKFLVTAVEVEDGECWHVPAEMLKVQS